MVWNPAGDRSLPVRFSVLVPVIMFSITMLFWQWGLRQPVPKGSDTPFVPTTPMWIAYGVSAPAVVFRALPIELHWTGRWPASNAWGFNQVDVFFFVGVVLLWYLVGRALDRWLSKIRTSVGVGRIVVDLLLIALGVFLFIAGIEGLLMRRPEATFFFVWGCVLIFFPGLQLFNAIRKSRQPI